MLPHARRNKDKARNGWRLVRKLLKMEIGIMYWDGDGVPRDHPTAARWFQTADKGGEPRAAKVLGDWAFVRLTQAAKPEDADRAILEEAIGWYQKALQVEPVPAARAQAQQRLEMLAHFKQQLPPR
jgi:TPR repeat protein